MWRTVSEHTGATGWLVPLNFTYRNQQIFKSVVKFVLMTPLLPMRAIIITVIDVHLGPREIRPKYFNTLANNENGVWEHNKNTENDDILAAAASSLYWKPSANVLGWKTHLLYLLFFFARRESNRVTVL